MGKASGASEERRTGKRRYGLESSRALAKDTQTLGPSSACSGARAKPSLLRGAAGALTGVEAAFLQAGRAQVVVLADEFVLVDDVELLARRQLLVTNHAGETVQVKDFAPRFAHQVRRRDALRAPGAFGTESPAEGEKGQRQQGQPGSPEEER